MDMLKLRNRLSIALKIASIAVLTSMLTVSIPTQLGATNVPIRGANGTVVHFAGVREATTAGVFLMVTREQGEIFVEWTSFDIEDLKNRQPAIHAAYKRLRTGGQPVALNLGLYANIKTLEEFTAELKKRTERELRLNVPPMTEFFDMSGFDSRYDRSNLNSVYSSWERRSSTYAREYDRLMEEFFGLAANENVRSSWWYGSAAKPKYTVITEIRPSHSSVNKPIIHFLQHFANPNARGTSMLVTYLRSHPDVFKAITEVLDKQSEALGNGLVMGAENQITVLKATVDDVRQHLHGMLQSTTLSANFQRDFDRYIQTWKLGSGARRF